MSRLRHVPVTLADANAFVASHHRHHKPVQGHKFSLGAAVGDDLHGVAIVGRPVNRHRDDGWTLEVTRLCSDGRRDVCSFLYSHAWRAARALGYLRIGTYIRADEDGTSLLAAGWRMVARVSGREWDTPSRPRDPATTEVIDRTLWEAQP